tara:strand:- start:273 stop:416 length:144 start_codon:yes stop_codon:yes gene_type:complete
MKYTVKDLDRMKSMLNGKGYSETWYRKHFRGMLDALYQIMKEKESEK